MEKIWFDNWESIIRIIVITPLAYFAMVFLLRISGKRTLTKMNAFDFVITIALGSTLSSVVLDKNISLADGVLAILLFIMLQFLLTSLSVRWDFVKNLITSSPTLIYYKGNFLKDVLKKERITLEEIYSAARQKGLSTLEGVDLIILEKTGDIAIIEKLSENQNNTLNDVELIKINKKENG